MTGAFPQFPSTKPPTLIFKIITTEGMIAFFLCHITGALPLRGYTIPKITKIIKRQAKKK